MSLLKANSVQIGQSATATENFTLAVPSSPDGTIKLARGNSGSTTADIFSVDAGGTITGATISGATINSSTLNGGSITLGTAQASTSGTAIDFTGIPSWARRITVIMSGVSTSGTSNVQVQAGSGSFQTSGYLSSNGITSGGAASSNASTSGFVLGNINLAADIRSGHMVITNISGNIYVSSFIFGGNTSTTDASCFGGGNVTLSGTLDRIRITTVNGTDTFDAGSINIMYEG